MTRSTVKHYFITLFICLVLGALWLGLIAQPFYQAQIGFLLAEKANWAAAGVFYLLCVAGLVTFVVAPALRAWFAGAGRPRMMISQYQAARRMLSPTMAGALPAAAPVPNAMVVAMTRLA